MGWRLTIVALLLGLSWGCDDGGLRHQLATALPGDEVTIPAGRYEGPFAIGSGAIVNTSGEVVITIEQADNQPALYVLTGNGSTSITGLRIESDGRAGIYVQGGGEFFANNIVINATRGVGLAVNQGTSLTLNNVKIIGSVTQATVPQLSYPLRDTTAPTIGLVLSNVMTRAELVQVEIKGFAGFGAVFNGSQVFWRGGGVTDCVGVGVMVEGGKLDSTSPLTISNIWAGTEGVGMPAIGMMLSKALSGVDMTSTTVSNVEGIGVIQMESRAIHRTLKIENSKDVGLWLQSSTGTLDAPSLKVLSSSSITGNVGGGIMLVNSGGIEISDSMVSGTKEKEMATDLGQEQIGDGVHVASLSNALTLQNVKLADNVRAGLLLSGNPPEVEKVRLTNVEITGSGKYGLLTVNGFKKEADWDVKRDANLQQADNAFSGKFGGAAALGTLPNISLLATELEKRIRFGSSVSPAGIGP